MNLCRKRPQKHCSNSMSRNALRPVGPGTLARVAAAKTPHCRAARRQVERRCAPQMLGAPPAGPLWVGAHTAGEMPLDWDELVPAVAPLSCREWIPGLEFRTMADTAAVAKSAVCGGRGGPDRSAGAFPRSRLPPHLPAQFMTRKQFNEYCIL